MIKISDVSYENIFDVSDSVFTIEPVTTAENLYSTIPGKFELKQNYPNPFNPTTTIYYGLPNESSVEIIIFDLLGKNVMSFTKDNQPAGFHSLNFDAGALPSGVYFYQLRAGSPSSSSGQSFVETKKMVLMK